MNQRFTNEENAAIATARRQNPNEKQRSLAAQISGGNSYTAYGTPRFILRNRSQASIYGALRRHDASLKAATVGGTASGSR